MGSKLHGLDPLPSPPTRPTPRLQLAEHIYVPTLSDMEDAAVALWHKASGDWIERGETVAEIDTGKVTIEVEATSSGYLEILAPEGAEVSPGAAIARLVGADERKTRDEHAPGD